MRKSQNLSCANMIENHMIVLQRHNFCYFLTMRSNEILRIVKGLQNVPALSARGFLLFVAGYSANFAV